MEGGGRATCPILKGLRAVRALATEREWEVGVVPLVVGQRSVKEKEWLETYPEDLRDR